MVCTLRGTIVRKCFVRKLAGYVLFVYLHMYIKNVLLILGV